MGIYLNPGDENSGNMLSAYYSKGCDSHGLFDSLKIASVPDYEEKLNKYNVIKNLHHHHRRIRCIGS